MFNTKSVTVKLKSVTTGKFRHMAASEGAYYPGMIVDGWKVIAIY